MSKKKKKVEAVAPTFTKAQRMVIDEYNGAMLAAAVAGAGKTGSIVERIKTMSDSGIELNRILLCAFNKNAAEDLNRKLKKRMGIKGESGEVARTLHSLARSIWKESHESEGIGLDLGTANYARAIRQGAKAIGMPAVEVDVVANFASRVKNDCLVSSFASGLRALGSTPVVLVDAAQEAIRAKRQTAMTASMVLDAYFAAESARTEGTELADGSWTRFVTFDDVLFEAARLLSENDEAKDYWQRCFDYVIVDEAQDMCEAQWRIVYAIAAEHKNIIVVGDPAQVIYRWRGAKPEYLLRFAADWPGAKTAYMNSNFRSGENIVKAANAVLALIPDDQKLPMQIVGTRGLAGFVGYRETDSPSEEAKDIAANARRHNNAGVEWKDQAVIVRRNDQSGPIEIAMLRAKIPARMVRGVSFFATREAKTALAYLRLAAKRADEEDFEVAIQNPPKYLGRSFIDKIVEAWEAAERKPDWLDIMDASPVVMERRYNGNARDFMGKIRELRVSLAKGSTPYQLFLEVCQKMNWERVEDEDGSNENDAAMNFDRIRDFLADFSDMESLFTTIAELKAAQRAAATSRNAVSICTAHGAKGLEWTTVYIAGVVKGTWPIEWSNVVDEHRLFYVAVTRARDELWLNGHRFKNDDGSEKCEPSMYLETTKLVATQLSGKQTLEAGQLFIGDR